MPHLTHLIFQANNSRSRRGALLLPVADLHLNGHSWRDTESRTECRARRNINDGTGREVAAGDEDEDEDWSVFDCGIEIGRVFVLNTQVVL